jgi:DNA-binding response OmpR family regulator
MLTAKGDDMDKILGLEYGADDYITKPFNILEVKARMKAIFRRGGKGTGKASGGAGSDRVISRGDFVLNLDHRSLVIAGKGINLTSKEFDLVELLAGNPGRVYSRDALLEAVWGADYPGDARTVDVHVRRLREKVEPNPSDPRYIQTKWGAGYYFAQN